MISESKYFALVLLVLAGAAGWLAAADQTGQTVESLLAQLDSQMLELDAKFSDQFVAGYSKWLELAANSAAPPLKQMVNLYAEIGQIRYSINRYGLEISKQLLLAPAKAESVVVEQNLSELLVLRAKLRTHIDAQTQSEPQWKRLYQLIELHRQGGPAAPASSQLINQLATEAHLERHNHQISASKIFIRQEELLEQHFGGDSQAEAQVLAKLDQLLDAQAGCSECRAHTDSIGEASFNTYPLIVSEQVTRSLVESHVDGAFRARLEHEIERTEAPEFDERQLDGLDDEDIGLQGLELLELAGVSIE